MFAYCPNDTNVYRATSNESGVRNPDIDLGALVHVAFPQTTQQDISEFLEVYDPARFSSKMEWIRCATGEPSLRCGVILFFAFVPEHL